MCVQPRSPPVCFPAQGPPAATLQRVGAAQNSGGTGAKALGRPWPKGISGNPGGRPQGLARATREPVGEDGNGIGQAVWTIAQNPLQRTSDRLEASKLLADRGWGKAAVFTQQEGDPLDLANVEAAAEEFRAKILRLAAEPEASPN